MAKPSIRKQALKTIAAVIDHGQSLSSIMGEMLGTIHSPQDRAFFQELVLGTLRLYIKLEQPLKLLLKKPLRKDDTDVKHALIMALYQIDQMNTPDYAAVNETVQLARAIKKDWATGLCNAVLRNYIKQKETLAGKLKDNEEYNTSFPGWLVRELKQDWPQNWQQIIAASNKRPGMTLRVNIRKTTPDEYTTMLDEAEIDYELMSHLPAAIHLDKPLPVATLPGYVDGLFSIQDGGAQFIPQLLQAEADHCVLDACAAPGGKTSHLLESTQFAQPLIANDIDETRLHTVQKNLARLGLEAELRSCDLNDFDKDATFDRILLDTPCSGTGVIRRHPDIKWLRTAKDIQQFASTQATLLDSAWSLLKTKGMLLYVTCSILKAENDHQINAFLQRHGNAELQPIDLPLGHKTDHGWQILPGDSVTDGFYFSKLVKVANE